jgi:hypothetical protein
MWARENRERLLLAFDLQRTGVRMKRQSLGRQHPTASEGTIDRLPRAWLLDRPADAPGRAVPWPRKSASKK